MMMIDERDGNNVVHEAKPQVLSSGQVVSSGAVTRYRGQPRFCTLSRRSRVVCLRRKGTAMTTMEEGGLSKEEGLVPKEEGDNDVGDEGGLQLPTGPAASTRTFSGQGNQEEDPRPGCRLE
eukprot:gene23811-9374_t